MATSYVNSGDTLEVVAGSTTAAGDVTVFGNIIGVALSSAASGEKVTYAISGVFTLPKVTTAVIGQGESVIWDASAGKFDDNLATPATGDVSGCCVAVAAAGNGATTVDVKLNVGVGTVA